MGRVDRSGKDIGSENTVFKAYICEIIKEIIKIKIGKVKIRIQSEFSKYYIGKLNFSGTMLSILFSKIC